MKHIVFFLICVLFLGSSYAQTAIKDILVKDIDGNAVTAPGSSGKKTLFMVLPVSSDTAIINQLTRFEQRYGDKVQVVGILSREDGYADSLLTTVKALYQPLRGAGLVLTEGVYTRSSAGAQEAPLVAWLTDRTKNRHYSVEVSEAGQKFFVSENGRLYGVLGSRTPLDGRIIERIVAAQVAADPVATGTKPTTP